MPVNTDNDGQLIVTNNQFSSQSRPLTYSVCLLFHKSSLQIVTRKT
jgi:hypothetical protein